MKKGKVLLLVGLIGFSFSLVVGANEAHKQLVKLPNKERNAMFGKLLADKGCGTVTRTFFQGFDDKRTAYWNAACKNGDAYMVGIGNDAGGSTKILSCAMLKAVNAGECFKKW